MCHQVYGILIWNDDITLTSFAETCISNIVLWWPLFCCWGSDPRCCICISDYMNHSTKSYCVDAGATDPGPVVTVAWSFVGRPSSVNLLHSPHTKDGFHLWLLGGGVRHWINNEEIRELFIQGLFSIPSQAGHTDDTGNSGNSFVIPAKYKSIFASILGNSIKM